MTNVTILNRAVEEGELWIDGILVAEGAHELCARRYEQLAEQVETQISALSAAASLPGFGGFDSGAALRRGFEDKAEGAVTRLRAYAVAARALAQTFRTAGVAYTHADSESAAAVANIEVAGVGHA